MMKAIFVGIYSVLTLVAISAQESIYSISGGVSVSGGNVSVGATSLHNPSVESLTSVNVPVRAAWFTGSRESGGCLFSYQTQVTQLSESWSTSWNGRVLLFYTRKLTFGYEISSAILPVLYFRYGPEVSADLNNGAYDTPSFSSGTSGSLEQYSFNLGAVSELDYFPFDTGTGAIDGLHLLVQASGSYSVSNFHDWDIGLRTGLGCMF